MSKIREIPIQKRYALGWYHEGVTHLSMHEYEEALSYFDRALKAVPDHPDFLIGKGEVLMAFGEYIDAYECFLAAATAEPENLKGCILLGTALLKLRRYEPADEAFLAAITLNRYDGDAWLGHAIACYHRGEEARAKDAFLTSYRFKPDQPELMYYLARTADSDQEAIGYLARGCRLDPKNIDLITEIAARLMNIGRFDDAAIFCRRACELCPEHPNVRAVAGRYREAQKKRRI
ncbi:tetratricopeptide repeat protein [Methanofollis formosanus]|uniref:Tetratricopeptide repeat protein n=1 Tax=Methanofollis formosanus TaxID=299308 RepID=A0A8G1A0J4_9EURY|nr:tetratricopeptide repeat protein [Methanofollis formosanus]QYZ78815.1 tetratricopeptide repeat protein [Methanofollis formosanus]